MVHLWMVTLGFLIVLGLFCSLFIHFLRTALHTEDSTRIDAPNLTLAENDDLQKERNAPE